MLSENSYCYLCIPLLLYFTTVFFYVYILTNIVVLGLIDLVHVLVLRSNFISPVFNLLTYLLIHIQVLAPCIEIGKYYVLYNCYYFLHFTLPQTCVQEKLRSNYFLVLSAAQ
jgi:hypothetical protein